MLNSKTKNSQMETENQLTKGFDILNFKKSRT